MIYSFHNNFSFLISNLSVVQIKCRHVMSLINITKTKRFFFFLIIIYLQQYFLQHFLYIIDENSTLVFQVIY